MAQEKINLYAGAGYQNSNSRWSIAGNSNGGNPNIYSELIWKNLQSATVQVGGTYRFYKQWGLRAEYGEAFIQGGRVTDTDYGADNRQQPVYKGVFKDDKGHFTSFHAALTYTFQLHHWYLTPMLGYVYNRQALYILPSHAGDPSDLHSTYNARWQGLLVGVEAMFYAGKRMTICPSLQYDPLQYDATANWNLITQFSHPKSFTHAANGYTLQPALQVNYTVHTHVKIFARAQYAYWKTGHGTDKLFLTTGETDVTQLNGVIRHEGGALLGIMFTW
ncbi:hypothetical protein GA0116948_104148 [Chitinophaga costaii]|uniref:Protochlamydia outer membrane protein domain-containing protein n=2 Tax=Chitinophaga costaii TaxID=1335309 RepID=A0A1C4CIW3_9BACT|nr:hypothetical protein GA0116948_104148 [Chitinophaga costaii]